MGAFAKLTAWIRSENRHTDPAGFFVILYLQKNIKYSDRYFYIFQYMNINVKS